MGGVLKSHDDQSWKDNSSSYRRETTVDLEKTMGKRGVPWDRGP